MNVGSTLDLVEPLDSPHWGSRVGNYALPAGAFEDDPFQSAGEPATVVEAPPGTCIIDSLMRFEFDLHRPPIGVALSFVYAGKERTSIRRKDANSL